MPYLSEPPVSCAFQAAIGKDQAFESKWESFHRVVTREMERCTIANCPCGGFGTASKVSHSSAPSCSKVRHSIEAILKCPTCICLESWSSGFQPSGANKGTDATQVSNIGDPKELVFDELSIRLKLTSDVNALGGRWFTFPENVSSITTIDHGVRLDVTAEVTYLLKRGLHRITATVDRKVLVVAFYYTDQASALRYQEKIVDTMAVMFSSESDARMARNLLDFQLKPLNDCVPMQAGIRHPKTIMAWTDANAPGDLVSLLVDPTMESLVVQAMAALLDESSLPLDIKAFILSDEFTELTVRVQTVLDKVSKIL